MRTATKPVYVKPEQVNVGDTIRVTFKELNGITTEMVGTVHERQHEGSDRVYYTREGGELFRWNISARPTRITLLSERDPDGQVQLFDYESLLNSVK